jgi:membrane-associated phospholipid phosphatase
MPDVQLPLVEGVRMNYWLSFPSGHTTSFFALFFAMSIILTTKRSYSTFACGLLQAALWALAALGGYSRIYLSQHFAADVFAGIIVGIGITILCYAVLHRFEDKKWYNYHVFGLKKQKNTKK